jgi:glycosyltransferase involved in cell wall biosynthesis
LTGLPPDTPVEEDYKGMKVMRTPYFDLNWLSKRGFEGLETHIKEYMFGALDKIKPDIIHAHNMHYFSTVHGKLLNEYAKSNKIPLVLTAHNVWDDGLFLELTTKIVKWNHIIAVSQFIKDELCGIGLKEKDVTVVYHGVDINHFKPAAPSAEIIKKYPQLKGRKVIFHPARMGLAKGCDTSIKAMPEVVKQVPKAMLVLCGTKHIIDWNSTQEKDIAYLLHLVKVLKLENNVFVNMIPHKIIHKFYNISSVSLYPSSAFEPFGITMLESLASGVPMVVTDAGGMPEIIKEGLNGFVVRAKRHLELADRIIRLLKDDELRKRLGENGREMVNSNFTVDKMTDDTLKIYESVLKKGSK